jgi:hypothetical protein
LIGIDELQNGFIEANLYPNPSHSELNVVLNSSGHGSVEYFITDILGKKITRTTAVTSSKFRIDLSSFSSGLYFLHLKQGVKRGVKKFVIN